MASEPIYFRLAYNATSCSQISFANNSAAFPNRSVSLYQFPSCTITASPLIFPQNSLLHHAVTQSSLISVNCTPGLAVAIKLGAGNSGATNPTQRAMQAAGEKLYYGLYKDANHTQPWGDAEANDMNISQTTGSNMNLTAYGKVDQQNVKPGNYTDRVIVSVIY